MIIFASSAPLAPEAVRAFLEFAGDRIEVAHNASFDTGFIAEVCRKEGIPYDPTYVDTVEMARSLMPDMEHHRLNNVAEALNVVNRALEVNDSSMLYLYAKSTVLFNMGRYDESIALSDTLIAMNDSLPEPYYNAGTAYINKALKLHPLREKKQVRSTYSLARPYMERYRKLAPQQKQKWGPALYRIYLNLNMGKQFDEIDRLLKE